MKQKKEVIKIRIFNYNELLTLKQVKTNLYESYDKFESSLGLIEIAQDATILIEASCDKTGKIEAMTDELEQIIKEVITALSKTEVNTEDKEALTSLIIAKEQLKKINKPLESYCNCNEGSKHKYCTYKECIYKKKNNGE